MEEKKLYRMIFGQIESVLALSFLLMQQVLVAFSTYFAIQLTRSIVESSDYLHYALALIAAILLNYLPGIFYAIYTEKVIYNAVNRYTHQFIKINKSRISQYTSSEFREQKEPWLTNESSLVIHEAVSESFNCLSLLLNITFNMLVIGFVLDTGFLIAYCLSVSILLIVMMFSKRYIAKASEDAQQSRNTLQSCLLQAWDNIFINNHYNLKNWQLKFSDNWRSCKQRNIHYVMQTCTWGMLAMTLALLPILGIMLQRYFSSQGNIALLAAMAVVLPRQLQIIQNVFSLFSSAMSWIGLKMKISNLAKDLFICSYRNDLNQRIRWDKITIYDESKIKYAVKSCDDILKIVASKNTGRLTITGENGSGKTSLLQYIKEHLDQKAFYLPAQHSLAFRSLQSTTYSTGEKLKLLLQEIQQEITEPWLLFDEWDANLDHSNREQLSAIINDLATKHCVWEISHRVQSQSSI